MSQNGVLTKLM